MKKEFLLMAIIVFLSLGVFAQAAQAPLVAHYTFQEGSGPIAADTSGFGNDAVINGATWADAKLNFDGTGDYLDPGTTGGLGIDETGGFTGNMSITAWVHFNTSTPAANTNYHIFNNLVWNTSGQTLRIEADGTLFNLKYVCCDEPWGPGNGGYYQKSTADILLSNDTTYHIAFVRNGGNVKIFIDGVIMADQDLMLPKANSEPFYISNPSQSFAGQLMDVQIFNVALTNEEVVSQSEIAPPTPGQVAHYVFQDGSGDIVTDVSGNGNDAMRNGASWGFNKMNFDGINDYLDLGTTGGLGISEAGGYTRNMSYAAWVHFNPADPAANTNWHLFNNVVWNTSGQWLRVEGFGSYMLLRYGTCDEPWGPGNGGYYQRNGVPDIYLLDDTTYHIGFVRDGDNVKIFVDGVVMFSGGLQLPKANSEPLLISNLSQAFAGSMMDVQFFNKAISDGEMASLAGVIPEAGGLVAHYDFHDGSGTIASDISGKGNDALIDGASWGFNKLNFDGNFDFMTPGTMGDLGIVSDMTFAARVHFNTTIPNADTNYHLFSNLFPNTSGQTLRIEANGDGTTFALRYIKCNEPWGPGNGGYYEKPITNITLSNDTTYHIGLVIDGLMLKFYIDGVLTTSVGVGESFNPNSEPLYISTNSNQSWAGSMMDVRFYNIPISDAEMAAIAAEVPPAGFTLSGTVNLLDFGGDKTAIPVTVELNGTLISLNLDADGKFTILDVPAGTYDVRIKASHWLAKLTSGVVVSANTVLNPVDLINGDVVDNNEVDFSDINATRAAYGSFPGDETWNELADVDGSGEVDFTDINIVRSKYGEIGD